MADKCKVCEKELLGSKCEYCGYVSVESLDDYGDQLETDRANKYKTNILQQISDFTISAFVYAWNDNTSKLESSRVSVQILDKIKYFDEINWSKKSFGQTFDQPEQNITIFYKYNGNNRELRVKLKPIRCNDFWRLGIMVHQDLKVSFYLGTVDNYTTSGPYDLTLK